MRFATNTSAELTAFDIMLLGAGPLGYTALLTHTGQPLAAARFRRSASIEQRIALIAAELVCTQPGCDEPAINCEVHHIRPWASGGLSNLGNLTLLCRGHHMQNNDARDPLDSREYSERDPATGRVGKKAPPTMRDPDPPVRLNHSVAAERSAGARLRKKYAHVQAEDRLEGNGNLGDRREDAPGDRRESRADNRSKRPKKNPADPPRTQAA